MITEEEKQYIAEHWLPHKYLDPYIWGKSIEKANPETYLAIKRGAIFVNTNTSIECTGYTVKALPNTYTFKLPYYKKKVENFLSIVLSDWLIFLDDHEIITQSIYVYFMQKYTDIIRQKIYARFHPIENNERIYLI